MNKKLIGSMFLAVTLLWSAQALSEEAGSVEPSQDAPASEASSPEASSPEAKEPSPEASSPEAKEPSQEASSPEATEPLPSGQGWRLVRTVEIAKTGKFVQMVLVDVKREMDQTVYSAAIQRLCGKETEFCRIRFWTQERFIPEKVTLTHEQLKAQKAEFILNKSASIRKTTWSCDANPDKTHCVKY